MNHLYLGDNLEILRNLPAESVDLIYLDPPFFSNRNYEVIWGDKGEIRSFQDRWAGGIDHYIAWLKERVAELHRVLKPTGSIFLHCDWHANAYIRVYILDKIFGENNLINEIVWRRTIAHNNAKKFGYIHDTIFYYSKSPKRTFHPVKVEHSQEQLGRYKEDELGLYRAENLTAPGKARQFVWRGVHPGENRSWAYSIEKLEEFYVQGKILLQKDGRPRKDGLKIYFEDTEKPNAQSIWNDIPFPNTTKERLGYPTQKPEALLERIINCASNEGDTVLDPFVGGGTTVAVADRLNRAWIGIDQSVQAVKVTEMRLQKQQNLFSKPFVTVLHKYDYDTLRYKEAFEFEQWIVNQRGGTPNTKQRGDSGIDGKKRDGTPIQVKRSDNIGRNVVDNFVSAAKRYDSALFEKNKAEGKPIGEIIAFSFGKGAVQEVARLKNEENLVIELVKVEDIVPIAKKPTIRLELKDLGLDAKNKREIEFMAVGESEAGIEFYAWQWDYSEKDGFKPDVMIDKEGIQKQKFSAGTYAVAVKVVDNDGLEAIEVVRMKVNGGVSRG
jgi:DNA modification methylase